MKNYDVLTFFSGQIKKNPQKKHNNKKKKRKKQKQKTKTQAVERGEAVRASRVQIAKNNNSNKNNKQSQQERKKVVKKKMAERYDYLFKFIVIGDSNTGKSCILHRFIEKKCKKTKQNKQSINQSTTKKMQPHY